MSWVNSDRTEDKDIIISMVRGALIDEISATDLYDRLSYLMPEYKDVLIEIRQDELNHQGRLLDIIMKLDKTQLEPFNKGLEQEE